jgi:hypothetical protein
MKRRALMEAQSGEPDHPACERVDWTSEEERESI